MDFSLTPEDLDFRARVVRFAQNELNDDLIERDRESRFSREAWNRCAAFGIQGLPIPEAYGGMGADIMTTTVAMEALGYGCRDNGLLFSMHAQMWSLEMPLLLFGTEEQKTKYLPGLCDGTIIGVHGMTEPDSGSDAFSLKTRAEKKGDRYVLNGSKIFITNAPIADVVLVFANEAPEKGIGGISAFLVEKGTPGFTVSRHIEKMGLRTSPFGELVFQDCEIPAENRVGKMGIGVALFSSSMEWERAAILGSTVGAMERTLETCVRYAKERKQFGKPIGKFQAVSQKLADMKIRLETSRLILYKVAWVKKQGKKAHMEAAIAKVYISEAAVKSNLDAVQIHGGYGFTTEFVVERELRDSIGGTIYSGTSEIQRQIIASWMGL
jgi:alkylation response protein AidB-like acyl-CoA dehydrogenase